VTWLVDGDSTAFLTRKLHRLYLAMLLMLMLSLHYCGKIYHTIQHGAVVIYSSEISAQEAVFHLLGLTMLLCTTKCVFAPTDLPDNRV